MWTADRWEDFSILDATGGKRLERWEEKILERPDPQVIWKSKRSSIYWKSLNARYHRSNKGGGSWEIFDLPDEWSVSYDLLIGRTLSFKLKPFSFKHTGLFPEQAVNWDWFSSIINKERSKRDPSEPVSVLNLFAYTGGATLAAAAAGAEVVHVDASKGMVGWAKENAIESGLKDAPIRWLVDDCKKFVQRENRRGHKYDGIILDPPSYGRGPKKEIWKLEDEIYDLLLECRKILKPEPLFLLLNSYTTGLAPSVLTYLISIALDGVEGTVSSEEVGLPVESSGLILPCGAAGRFIGKRAL